MPSFVVRYRSRGTIREVRWTDGRLSAEPLVETIVATKLRAGAVLDHEQAAAQTVLEALHDVGASIIGWDGDTLGR